MSRDRSPESAQELVRRYESSIRLAVRTRLTDPALKRQLDSADICQSVLASFFVRAAAGQHDLADPGQLVALLVRMARNKLVGHVRFHRRQRRDAHLVSGQDRAAERVADGRPAPDQIAAARDLLVALRAGLTPEERDLADRRGAGQGWAEIAAALGGTATGRRMQLKRALDRHFPEFLNILATAAGNPPRDPDADYSQASISIIAKEATKREPHAVMAELVNGAFAK
jgi:DNA-directed RNA polymerase specialized sigma24 family protein